MKVGTSQDKWTGDAWPSSVRGLNCTLKWANERNPRCVLQVSHETAPTKVFNKLKILVGEEGEDDARSACPFDTLGYTHNTMAVTMRSDEATLS
jgi:hypothetical protein